MPPFSWKKIGGCQLPPPEFHVAVDGISAGASFQEGLLDMTLRFSDGTSTPLTDVAESDFSLTTRSLDRTVVELALVAPSSGGRAARPRIVAVGQGQGNLLQVTARALHRHASAWISAFKLCIESKHG